MDPAQRSQLSFILTLIGGIVGVVLGIFVGMISLFISAIFDYVAKNPSSTTTTTPPPPPGVFLGLFGFMAIVAIAGGITMLVSAPRLRRGLPAARSAAIASIVGGALCLVMGNAIAGGLGIAGGIITLVAPEARNPAQGAVSP